LSVNLQANAIWLVCGFENRQKNGQEKQKPDQGRMSVAMALVNVATRHAGWYRISPYAAMRPDMGFPPR